MKRIILISLMALFIFISCSKKEESNPQKTVLTYFPLEVGNYWVYERSGCDSTWSDCSHISTDTNWITKDTLINNHTYFKLEGKSIVGNYTTSYLRDSGDYIVNETGHIIISNTDFDRKIYERYEISPSTNDTLFYIYNLIKDKPNNVEVPAGTYNCIDFRGSFFRKHDNFEKEYNYHNYFAENVGSVYQNAIFASSLGGLKRELVSFNVSGNKK